MAGHVVLVGPTASGKSALAMAVASQTPGAEIVSVDAMCVYREMDTGTAKPTVSDRSRVPHHMIDVLDPSQECTVAWFKSKAVEVLDGLEERNATALLVGGTGLYVRAVVDDLQVPGRWPAERAELEADSDTDELYRRLSVLDAAAAAKIDRANRRRIIRALEVSLGSGRPFSSFGPGLDSYEAARWPMVGLRMPRALLDSRIRQRFLIQMESGLLDEVERLRVRPGGMSRTARQALGYKELIDHLDGNVTLEAAIESAVARIRRFARRQERWFRRDPRIQWIDITDEDPSSAAQVLSELTCRGAVD